MDVRNCVVCNRAIDTGDPDSAYQLYWVHSQRRGYDVPTYVCPQCDRHPKHAAMVAANVVKAEDKQ